MEMQSPTCRTTQMQIDYDCSMRFPLVCLDFGCGCYECWNEIGLDYLHKSGIIHGDLRGVSLFVCQIIHLFILTCTGKRIDLQEGESMPFGLWIFKSSWGGEYWCWGMTSSRGWSFRLSLETARVHSWVQVLRAGVRQSWCNLVSLACRRCLLLPQRMSGALACYV